MTESPDNLSQLYYEFGRTAELAQTMEVEAGTLVLVYSSIILGRTEITDEHRKFFQALNQDISKRTLGNLLHAIRETGQISDDIITALSNSLDKRNYLVHHFFPAHNFAIYSVEGRATMIAELKEIQECFVMARAMLSAMSGSLDRLLSEVFGRNQLFGEEGDLGKLTLKLMEEGNRVEI